MSKKALQRTFEPHETEYTDPVTGRQPWKEIRKWEAGPKPSDILAEPDVLLLPWRRKQILSEQMRNSNTYPRRVERPTGFYLQYLERLIQKRAKERKGEQQPDPDSEEKYWREREKLNTERQNYKRAA